MGTILGFGSRWHSENLLELGKTLSESTLRSFARAREWTVGDYREALAVLRHAQSCFADLASLADGISSTSPGPAAALDAERADVDGPIYAATGDPSFNLPASALVAPAIMVPLLAGGHTPLGVEVIGQAHDDYRICGYARWMLENLQPVSVVG